MFLRGEQPIDPQSGWGALKSINRSRESGVQVHIKLLSPQVMVSETLDKAGFTQFFEVFNDLKKAADSF
jgi:anti-anti-sigma regulatory factor